MPLVTLNGDPVISMELHRPRIGCWYTLVEIDTETLPSGVVEIKIGESGNLYGTVDRTGHFARSVSCRVVGGNANLSAIIPPRYHAGATIGIILADTLLGCGAGLYTVANGPELDVVVPKWATIAAPAYQAIAKLAEETGLAWRVMPEGTVWMGLDTWPDFPLDYVMVSGDPIGRHITIASEDYSLIPGVTLDGMRIDHVIHSFGSGGVRTEAWLADDV